MKKNKAVKKPQGKAMPRALLSGLLAGVAVCTILLLTLPLFIVKLSDPDKIIPWAVIAIALASGFSSGFFSMKALSDKKLVAGLISGLLFCGLLLTVSLFWKNTAQTSVFFKLLVAVTVVFGSFLGGKSAFSRKKSRKT